MIIIQKQRIKNVGKDVEKLESLCFPGGIGAATVENGMVIPKIIKHKITI